MKKGKVEFFYKVAMLMEDGKIGVDFMFTQERLNKQQLQELAEALKTDCQIVFIGTIIMPPNKEKATFEYNILDPEEKAKRIKLANEYAAKEYEEEQKLKKIKEAQDGANESTIQ